MTKKKKLIKALIIITVVLISGLLLVAAIVKKTDAKTYIKQATECFEENKYSMAIDYFDKALKYDSKNVEAYIGKADCYIMQDNIDSALRVMEFGYKKTKSDKIYEKKLEISKSSKNPKSEQDLFFVDDSGVETLETQVTMSASETSQTEMTKAQQTIVIPEVNVPNVRPTEPVTTPVVVIIDNGAGKDDGSSGGDSENSDNTTNTTEPTIETTPPTTQTPPVSIIETTVTPTISISTELSTTQTTLPSITSLVTTTKINFGDKDITKVMQMYLLLIKVNENDLGVYDLNKNNKIDLIDLMMMIKPTRT